eukprot:RCo033466
MAYIPHVFVDNVFQIIKLMGDPELQEKIKKRDTNFQHIKDVITVPYRFNKMVELVQTRRDIWFIAEEKWLVSTRLHEPTETTRAPGTLQYYMVPELTSLCDTMIKMMADRHEELRNQWFLRIEIKDFSDKDEAGSEVSLRISYFS